MRSQNHGTTIALHLCDNCCTIRGSPNYRHSDYPDNQLLTHPLALLSAFKSEFPSPPITSSSTSSPQCVDFLKKQHLQNFYPQSANVVIFAPKKALLAFMHTTFTERTQILVTHIGLWTQPGNHLCAISHYIAIHELVMV